MKLAIAEVLQRADVAAAFDAFHVAVPGDPLGRGAIHADPLREVFAIEQHRGIRRRLAGLVLCAGGGRSHDGRLGPVAVVVIQFGSGCAQQAVRSPTARRR